MSPSNFNKYLIQFTKNIENSNSLTHIAFKGGKYKVPEEKYDEFHQMYYNALKNNEDLYLIEKINDDTKFGFFLDIEVPKSHSKYLISYNDISFIIDKCKSLSTEFFDFESNDKCNEHIVSERNNKFHINFPNLIVNSSIATVFAKELLSLLENSGLHKYIDMSVYRTGLRMLGSKKNETKENEDTENYQSTYTIININTENLKENDIKCPDFDLFMKTIIRKKSNTKVLNLKEKYSNIYSNFSNSKNKKQLSVKGIEHSKIIDEIINLVNSLDEIKQLENNKIEVGKIVAKQNKSGLFCFYVNLNNKFCPFKQREHSRDSSPIYLEININGINLKCFDIDCKFKKFPDEPIKLPIDFQNKYPELYLSIHTKYWKSTVNVSDELRELLEDSLSGSHYKIAKAAFYIYKNRFRIDDIKNADWYEFDGILWKKSYIMNILISEDLPKYYNAIKISDTSNPNIKGDLKDFLLNQNLNDNLIRNELIDNIISKLENVTFKKNITTEMCYLFKSLEPDFISKLDKNPYLIGFKNGVYDLEKMTLRNGSQSDYLTYSTGYDYIEYDPELPEIQDIYEFLQKIITNKNVFDYLLKILGRTLLGIEDERFYIFTGLSGANGKSTLMNFLEYTLGDYAIGVDVSLLTNKRALSSNASPDVMRIKGRRLVTFQEPEAEDVLKTGIIKSFSGGDTITARDLFKAPVGFKIQATMIMCCNDIPKISSIDGGTFRRLRVIDFTSRFCDNPTKENEFHIDPTIKNKIKQWKPFFMSILIHHYKLYRDEINTTGKIVEPEEVLLATNKFKADNDLFNEYFTECIQEDSDSFETNKSIYNHFNMWWTQNYNNNKIPDHKQLKKSMIIKFGDEVYCQESNKLGFKIKFRN